MSSKLLLAASALTVLTLASGSTPTPSSDIDSSHVAQRHPDKLHQIRETIRTVETFQTKGLSKGYAKGSFAQGAAKGMAKGFAQQSKGFAKGFAQGGASAQGGVVQPGTPSWNRNAPINPNIQPSSPGTIHQPTQPTQPNQPNQPGWNNNQPWTNQPRVSQPGWNNNNQPTIPNQPNQPAPNRPVPVNPSGTNEPAFPTDLGQDNRTCQPYERYCPALQTAANSPATTSANDTSRCYNPATHTCTNNIICPVGQSSLPGTENSCYDPNLNVAHANILCPIDKPNLCIIQDNGVTKQVCYGDDKICQDGILSRI